MPPIDAWASQVHYAAHIQPIWDALPARGVFQRPPGRPHRTGGPIIVASHNDYRQVSPRPVVFVEHGAGQTYVDNRTPAGYAGGPNRDRVILFVCPSERVAEANRKQYPNARVVVGSPWLEWLRARNRLDGPGRPAPQPSPQGRPALSFHWDCKVSPEARSAWGAYQDIPEYLDMSQVIGHGHPRIWPRLRRWWETVGAEPVEAFHDVAQQASAYVCDNSSTIYEAAALDIPVVLLNAPWYRKDVWHGLRFWEHLPGPMVDRASDIPRALREAPEWYEDRRIVTEAVYQGIEGAAQRAADAILELPDLGNV